jgi:hypothetical protein
MAKEQESFLKKLFNLTVNISLIALLFIAINSGCKKDQMTEEEMRESITHQLTGAISSDTLQAYVKWMQDMGTRFALADNHRNVAMKIRNRFITMGYSDVRTDSFQISKVYLGITYQQWQYNVIASIRGSIYPDSICIIGAHYDDNLRTGNPMEITPGANDNASGVSATLEMARVMKKYKYSPKNTIEFIAFGSEELGLYGSYAYASNAITSLKKIKLMLNNDMIAYQPGVNKTEWIVNIIDYDNSHKLRTMAESMCIRYTGLQYKNDNTYSKQSDSYPFFLSGYPAIFFFSNIMDNNYHTVSDLAENCNFEYCREIVKLNCAILVGNN